MDDLGHAPDAVRATARKADGSAWGSQVEFDTPWGSVRALISWASVHMRPNNVFHLLRSHGFQARGGFEAGETVTGEAE
jgi:hypothetical protein